jgi:hypothetical protein
MQCSAHVSSSIRRFVNPSAQRRSEAFGTQSFAPRRTDVQRAPEAASRAGQRIVTRAPLLVVLRVYHCRERIVLVRRRAPRLAEFSLDAYDISSPSGWKRTVRTCFMPPIVRAPWFALLTQSAGVLTV